MNRIQSENKKLITCKINKFSLSCFEDKINNLDNGFNGFNALSVSAQS